ncbi:hypothetical protein PHOSAC3_90580 [Mesotoga infera]|jgi:hypothetical protein|nr:hypothetical protein PHOSAC3_90580 [Mesotoga infera]
MALKTDTVSVRLEEKIKGANTKRFLSHCFTLINLRNIEKAIIFNSYGDKTSPFALYSSFLTV